MNPNQSIGARQNTRLAPDDSAATGPETAADKARLFGRQRRYFWALLAAGLGALAQWQLKRFVGPLPPFLLSYPAVFLVCMIWGGLPGLVTTATCALIVGEFFIPWHRSSATLASGAAVSFLVFLTASVAFCALVDRLRISAASLDRKATQRALLSTRKQLQALIDTAVDGIISIDERGIIISFNPAAAKIFGYTREEMIGQKLHRLMPPSYEQQHDDYLLRYLRTGKKRVIGIGRELTGLRKDGSIFPMDLALNETVLEHGRVFTGFVRDISDRKRAQAEILRLNAGLAQKLKELETLLAVLPIGVAVAAEPECSVIHANPALRKMMGLTTDGSVAAPAGEIESPNFVRCENLLKTPEPAEFPLKTAIKDGVGVSNVELQLLRQDGTSIPVAASAAPLLDAQGHVCGGVSVIWDMSEFKRVEALRSAADVAQAANRAKDELLAMISHDLRTPIGAILLMTTVMKLGDVAENVRQDISQIEDLAKTQSRLIEDILDATRILHGKMHMEMSLLDLRNVAQAAVMAVDPIARSRKIELGLEIPAGDAGSLWVMGDSLRLQQVGWNLLTNAVKFSPVGGKVVLRLEEAGAFVLFSVIDHGQGVSPEKLPHLFDRLSPGEQLRVSKPQGLGLGLFIVKHIVQAHGGTVVAESAGDGLGATFTVRLPALKRALTEDRDVSAIQAVSNPQDPLPSFHS